MPNPHEAPAGLKLFDTVSPLTTTSAKQFFDKGYRGVARYIPRLMPTRNDLTKSEIQQIFAGGLAVLPTQHVEPGEWSPTDEKARDYGKTAALWCQLITVPKGVHVVLDLESLAPNTPKAQVISYCNVWYDIVARAGYLPMIYLGWQIILDAHDAYTQLKFDRYWGAYNVDIVPATRGFCLKQHSATPNDTIPGYAIDVDLVTRDALGGLPILFAPDNWNIST